MIRLLVCHAAEDRFLARRIHVLLNARGYQSFVEPALADDKREPITFGNGVRAILLLASHHTGKSQIVREELNTARKLGRPVIALSFKTSQNEVEAAEATAFSKLMADLVIELEPEAPDFMDRLVDLLEQRIDLVDDYEGHLWPTEERAIKIAPPDIASLSRAKRRFSETPCAGVRFQLDEVIERYSSCAGAADLFDRILNETEAQPLDGSRARGISAPSREGKPGLTRRGQATRQKSGQRCVERRADGLSGVRAIPSLFTDPATLRESFAARLFHHTFPVHLDVSGAVQRNVLSSIRRTKERTKERVKAPDLRAFDAWLFGADLSPRDEALLTDGQYRLERLRRLMEEHRRDDSEGFVSRNLSIESDRARCAPCSNSVRMQGIRAWFRTFAPENVVQAWDGDDCRDDGRVWRIISARIEGPFLRDMVRAPGPMFAKHLIRAKVETRFDVRSQLVRWLRYAAGSFGAVWYLPLSLLMHQYRSHTASLLNVPRLQSESSEVCDVDAKRGDAQTPSCFEIELHPGDRSVEHFRRRKN